MIIGREEMTELIGDMAGSDSRAIEDWLNEKGIDEDTFIRLLACMGRSLCDCVVEEGWQPTTAFGAAIATSFQIGWEARDRYAGQ